MEPPLTFDGPEFGVRDRVLVLTHGAGSSSSHPSLAELARLIGEREIAVARFDFPYMRRAEQSGRRAWPPDDEDVLTSTWIGAIRQLLPPKRLVIGGRSLGGRVASIVADAAEVSGLVCVSYPFHPPHRDGPVRTAHLRNIETPTLIVQGERDQYGSREEVSGVQPFAEHSGSLDHRWGPRADAAQTQRSHRTGQP